MTTPILYSFRRCPYAMRARLAIAAANTPCELREILLRDKAPELLAVSPKATVPVLVTANAVIDESLDIMHWALTQNDPHGWLDMPSAGHTLIETSDGPFKSALDTYKYHDDLAARTTACDFLHTLNSQLTDAPYLFGPTAKLADMAILTFIRQFANVDKPWFDAQRWPHLSRWLQTFTASSQFDAIMHKYPKWTRGDPTTNFPD